MTKKTWAETEAESAIEESFQHNSIVTLDHDPELQAELERLSDDEAETGQEFEFWGGDEEEGAWRVHLRKQPRRWEDEG